MARGTKVNSKSAKRSGKKSASIHETPLHGSRIEDYALIGDCETAALVCPEGSIDWLCWPAFSSQACFAALLGTRDHGFWQISPKRKITASRRQYREGTLIVETVFETAEGEVCLTDFMPPRGKHSKLVRIVRCERGRVTMKMDLAIRFDYGRTVPWVSSARSKGKSEMHAVAGLDMVVLQTKAELVGEDHTTHSEFTLRKGQTMSFTLSYCSSLEKVPAVASADADLKDTQIYWTRWLKQGTYRGEYADAVKRSLMTLKALTYKPTGGIVAAVTTSLPEKIGGARNWDYRYCWLRDTSFTLLVLLLAGYRDEAQEWRRWLLRAVAGAPSQVQTIYGISGERDMVEWQADWLPGYEHSKPVRIGNGAVSQFQLDVFGEVASALARMPEAEDEIRMSARDMLIGLVDRLCEVWKEPDQGIWEVRGGPKHFTHSKVMAWVAVDRGILYMESRKKEEDAAVERALKRTVDRWKKIRTEIHQQVCAQGFDKKLNSFVQSYGSKALDASCLRIALVGFLPATDPRIVGTVTAIEKHLTKGGLIQRYKTRGGGDGLSGGEGQFLACSFWMVGSLWLVGRKQDATKMFERLLALRNDVGLLAEEYDSDAKRMVGNFPQALSHIALVHAAFAISGDWVPQHAKDDKGGSGIRRASGKPSRVQPKPR